MRAIFVPPLSTDIRSRNPLYCYILQVIIIANHMNGKDTHVRGLRLLGPVEYVTGRLHIHTDTDETQRDGHR